MLPHQSLRCSADEPLSFLTSPPDSQLLNLLDTGDIVNCSFNKQQQLNNKKFLCIYQRPLSL